MSVRRGGLAGEDGGWCRWAGGSGGGVGNLPLVRDGICSFGMRVVGRGPGGPLSLGDAPCGSVVSVTRKASRASPPPFMVRMCVLKP
jgi:hypothetical protein